MKLCIFMIPFEFGFMYSELVNMDLVFTFDVILFVLYILWILKDGNADKNKLYMGKATYFAILHILWSMTPIVLSQSRVSAVLGTILIFKAFLFYFYIINNVVTKQQIMDIVFVLMISVTLQGSIGILQKVTGGGLGLGFLGEMKTAGFGRVTGRVRGTLGFPNQYGAFIDLLLPFCMSFYFFSKSKGKKYIYGLMALACLFGLYFSFSRSSWFGIILALMIMTLILLRRGKFSSNALQGVLVIMFIIIIIAFVFWGEILIRFESLETGNIKRMDMLAIAFRIIISNPLTGVGLFNYEYHSFQYFAFWTPVHNEFVRLAAETGVPGLIFFLLFVYFVIRDAQRSLKLKSKFYNAVALGILGGYSAFLGAILFGPQYQNYRQKVVFWILAGLSIAMMRIIRSERRQSLLNQRLQNVSLNDLQNTDN